MPAIEHFVRKMSRSRGKIAACSPPKARANDPARALKNRTRQHNNRQQRQPKKLQRSGGKLPSKKPMRRPLRPQNNIAGQLQNQLFQPRRLGKSLMPISPVSHIHTGPSVIIRVVPPKKTGSGRRSNCRPASRTAGFKVTPIKASFGPS